MSIDTRTRRRSQIRELSAEEVVDDVLPRCVDEHGDLAAEGVLLRDLPSLELVCGERSVVLDVDGGRFGLGNGSAGGAAVSASITEEGLSNLVQDVQTPMGLAMTSRVEITRGGLDDWLAWEPTLHALVDGRPVHRPGRVTLVDGDGRPLDLDRSFTLDDDPAEAGQFLEAAGFLHVASVYAAEEMVALQRDIDACLAASTPDDGRSWWATDQDGVDHAVRALWFHERSAAMADLLHDERIRWFASLTGDAFEVGALGAEGLVKPLGIERGLSDLPWHKDCGQGMHSYQCSGLTLGISVTGADRTSGALGVIPGSHRANTESAMRARDLDLRPTLLETVTGDVTVHCSDTLHRAHPPVARTRHVVYTGVPLSALPEDDAEGWWRPRGEEARRARSALSDVNDRIDAASRDS